MQKAYNGPCCSRASPTTSLVERCVSLQKSNFIIHGIRKVHTTLQHKVAIAVVYQLTMRLNEVITVLVAVCSGSIEAVSKSAAPTRHMHSS